jgi:hypothetical protein
MNKKEKNEAKRRELEICIDYLERQQYNEFFVKNYEERADKIKELNKQLKELNR